MKNLILVIEDEPPIRDMIRLALELADFEVMEAENASKAESQIADRVPNLILLDWMLPGMSGIEFAKKLKQKKDINDIPIIILTAKAEEENKIKGFEVGADDYITKPFSPRELIARIKTVLRRGPSVVTEGLISIKGLSLNTLTQELRIQDKLVNLSPLEFRLLHFFMSHPNRVYSRDQLLTRVWGGDAYCDERTVDVQIRRLRRALNQQGNVNFIETVRGAGYKFISE